MAERAFEGKIVVIAGNEQALALELAHAYVEAGSRVVIVAAPGDGLPFERTSIEVQPVDLSIPTQSAMLVRHIIARYGQLDVWINVFVRSKPTPAESLTTTSWEATVPYLLSAAFYGAQEAGRHMLQQRHGVIANITSVLGLNPIEGHVANSVLHAGLQAMTNALGVEWAGRGVRVVGVALPVEMGEPTRRTPLPAAVTTAQLADALLYLTSDEAAYVTAETMRVDGGWSAYQLF